MKSAWLRWGSLAAGLLAALCLNACSGAEKHEEAANNVAETPEKVPEASGRKKATSGQRMRSRATSDQPAEQTRITEMPDEKEPATPKIKSATAAVTAETTTSAGAAMTSVSAGTKSGPEVSLPAPVAARISELEAQVRAVELASSPRLPAEKHEQLKTLTNDLARTLREQPGMTAQQREQLATFTEAMNEGLDSAAKAPTSEECLREMMEFQKRTEDIKKLLKGEYQGPVG